LTRGSRAGESSAKDARLKPAHDGHRENPSRLQLFRIRTWPPIGADGKIDVKKLRPIARLGYYDYTVVNEVFEMRMPGASAAELAGLEGTPR
jgi:hypothetical protein